MPSYQEIETRLQVVEDKIDFIMKTFNMQLTQRSTIDPNYVKVQTHSLYDLYLASKQGKSPLILPEVIEHAA